VNKSKTPFDRHQFCALYGFKCDCADCISPQEKARKKELARSIKASPSDEGSR